jgi:hypothetical protein
MLTPEEMVIQTSTCIGIVGTKSQKRNIAKYTKYTNKNGCSLQSSHKIKMVRHNSRAKLILCGRENAACKQQIKMVEL